MKRFFVYPLFIDRVGKDGFRLLSVPLKNDSHIDGRNDLLKKRELHASKLQSKKRTRGEVTQIGFDGLYVVGGADVASKITEEQKIKLLAIPKSEKHSKGQRALAKHAGRNVRSSFSLAGKLIAPPEQNFSKEKFDSLEKKSST